MERSKKISIAVLILTTMVIQLASPIIGNISYAVESKEEVNVWDVSKNKDRSIIATLSEDGELRIEGTGTMENYSFVSDQPWKLKRENINTVIIAEGISNIGGNAFYGCSNLTSIEIPESVKDIGNCAFQACSALAGIELPKEVVSIGSRAFMECTSLTTIKIPEEVKTIKGSAFYDCINLNSIEMPKNITSIESYMFFRCSSLTGIEIPEGVKTIGSYAFLGCSNLTKVEIPEGVKTIGDFAFYDCANLASIVIPNSVTSIGICELFGKENTMNIVCKSGSTAEKYAKENEINYMLDDDGPSLEILPNGSIGTKKIEVVVKATDEGAGLIEESLKYLWSTKSENVEKEEIVTEFKNGETLQKTGEDGIYYLWVYGNDALGNETITRSNSFKVDNTVPEYQVEYSSAEQIKGDVTVTITANEELQEIEGWTISKDKKQLTKVYNKNTEEEIIIKDLAGNEAVVEIKINNIEDYFYIEGYEIQDGYILEIPEQIKIEDFISKIKTNQDYTIYEMRKEEGDTEEKEVEAEGIIKTGQVIKVNGKVICTLVVKGDVTGNGIIDINDAINTLRHAVEQEGKELVGAYLKAAYMNEDNFVDVTDAIQILQYSVSK